MSFMPLVGPFMCEDRGGVVVSMRTRRHGRKRLSCQLMHDHWRRTAGSGRWAGTRADPRSLLAIGRDRCMPVIRGFLSVGSGVQAY